MTRKEMLEAMGADPAFKEILESLAELANLGDEGDVTCNMSIDRKKVYVIPPGAILAEVIGTQNTVWLVVKDKD